MSPVEAKKDQPDGINLGLSMLQHHGGRRGRQVVAAIAAAQLLRPAVLWAYTKLREHEQYSVTVQGADDIYPDLQEWVLARMPSEDRMALIASTADDRKERPPYDDAVEDPRVRLRYDGARRQAVSLGEHRVEVYVEREDLSGGSGRGYRLEREKITFLCPTVAARDAVVAMLDQLLAARRDQDQSPPLYMPGRWGGAWTRRGDLPPKALDSVVLKEGQLERLVEDLAGFLAAEDEYVRMSQPWHRGYLFHGPPGTGKTSVARALANAFDLPTYYLPLGDLDSDTDLMQLVADVAPRSVLLIEDVDVYHAATERDDAKNKSSVAAMLNALDGIWTPHGLITVLTTNNRDALDPALLRPGRVDVDEELGLLDAHQAAAIAKQFEVASILPTEWAGRSPAELMEEIRRCRLAATDPELRPLTEALAA